MKTKLKQLNLTYVLDIDGTEWLFIPAKDKEWKTSHNGCFCLSDEINHYSEPYFNPNSGRVTSDSDIDQIRLATDEEIDSFISIMGHYDFIINENNNLQRK